MPQELQSFPVLIGSEDRDWKASTLLIREVCMLKFVEELTNKKEWNIKIWDLAISERWKKEALEMDWETYRPYADFTPAMADAVSPHVIFTNWTLPLTKVPL